ncbi:MAG TPA: SIR2 family protein [Candidatus Angelobacter sp.]
MEILLEAQRLTVCVGSGISRRKLPLLNQIIALAFCNIPLSAEAREAFRTMSQFHAFHARLAADGVHSDDPCTLEEFRALNPAEQARLCEPLTATYGDVFNTLEHVVGSKRALLDCLDFRQFGAVDPDAAHFYIGYMILEGALHRVLTTNWDRLIETAVTTSTNLAIDAVLELLLDTATWLNRNQGPYQMLAKVHGCVTQYPDHCEQIILTTAELQLATGNGWRREAVNELLTGTVLFSGYSASDYTVMVPLQVLAQLRAENNLDSSHFYIAQEGDLSTGGRNLIQENNAKHIRLWANDTFASLYFAYIRRRLQLVITTAEQQMRLERAFPDWNDDSWTTLITRLRVLTSEDLGFFLDTFIGDQNARAYDERACRLPIGLSAIRTIFLTGRVPARGRYQNLQFDPNKDIVLLILLAAVIDLSRSTDGTSLSFESTHAGITLIERSGSRRKLCFLYGTYPTAAYHSISRYFNDIEDADGQLPEFEVSVVPCSRYNIPNDDFRPVPILGKALPGVPKAQRRFVDPGRIFQTNSYDALVEKLQEELEL